MSSRERMESDRCTEATANCRIGYEAAITLWASEANVYWSSFNAMLLAHSILVFAATSPQTQQGLKVAVSVLGVVLAVIWMFIQARTGDYHAYYIASARDLEPHIPPVDLSRRGQCLKCASKELRDYQATRLGQAFSIRQLAGAVIWAFLFLYAAVFVVSVLP